MILNHLNCFSVDGMLDGGMYTGEVTEVCGGVAAGKTQVGTMLNFNFGHKSSSVCLFFFKEKC